MSKPRPLYEKCEVCDGTRITNREIDSRSGVKIPVGYPCPCCSTGYHEIGMTARQLESLIEERDALLSFVGLVATSHGLYAMEIAKTEAQRLTDGKGARIAEYRHRKGLGEDGKPKPPAAPS